MGQFLLCPGPEAKGLGWGTGRQTQGSFPHTTPNPAWGHWPKSSSSTPTTGLAQKGPKKAESISLLVPSPLGLGLGLCPTSADITLLHSTSHYLWPIRHSASSLLAPGKQKRKKKRPFLDPSSPASSSSSVSSPLSLSLQFHSHRPFPLCPGQSGSGKKPRAPRDQADGHSLTASDIATCPSCWSPLLPQLLQQAWPADQF